MKIGIFGGTFNPPHIGHTRAAQESVKALGLDKLLVIPDAQPPHKALAEGSPDAGTRLELTRLAFAGVKRTHVSDMEIKRGGRSYTVDTLRRVRDKYPDAKLWLLMGTDMLMCFEEWRDFKAIMSMASLGVFARAGGEDETIRSAAAELEKKYGATVRFIETEEIEASSTSIRQALPKREGREFLTDEVYGAIIKGRLYGARPEFEWLRRKAYAMLDPKRVAHVAGCEQEAVRLARRWGADEEKAREAGILHDITKKEKLDEQLRLCEKYGIILDEMERHEGKLLYSKTGAGIAKYEFGCDDEVYGAIYWHTTGKEDMGLLEKVIYMADYIEPNRDFEGVDELRRLAYEDLDRALEMGFRMSIDDMTSRGIVPHARTLGALRFITKGSEK